MKLSIHDEKGFTLLEIMIVVAVLGILAAVAIPKFAEMVRKSKEGATKGHLSSLRSALAIYKSENEDMQPLEHLVNGTYDDMVGAIVPKYIAEIPTSKLGNEHSDSNLLEWSPTSNRGDTTDLNPDQNGWVFTSTGGSSWWVNCTHTDTGNEIITAW